MLSPGWHGTWRVTVSRFLAYSSSTSSFSAVGRLEIGQAEGLAVELEAVPQHMQRALGVQFLDQRCDQQRLQPRPVQRPHLRPELGLGFLNEGEHARREQRPLVVPLRVPACQPARVSRISST